MLAKQSARLAGIGIVVAAVACSQSAPPPGQSPPPPSSAPAVTPPASAATPGGFVIAPDLPTLNAAAVASGPRSVETIRAVYEFAARHPEVLSYVPCFCGCENAGHKHNTDCFVGGRTADGTVTSWDYHGVG
jgi:hypothetical protein